MDLLKLQLPAAPASLISFSGAGVTAAEQEASANWQANLGALRQTQPELAQAVEGAVAPMSWVYGRDGALTARDAAGRWHSGCSLPRRAAHAMLKTLDQQGPVGCFLAPVHAAQIQEALRILKPQQALIALMPSRSDLVIALHCGNLASDIQSHRLWLASGPQWPEELAALLVANPGLPVPQQFIRTLLLKEEESRRLIDPAQRVFAQEAQRRGRLGEELRQKADARPAGPIRRLCLLVPSQFRLWEEAPGVLAGVLGQSSLSWRRLDPDDPCCNSNLALALAADECDALLLANVGRGDLPGVLSPTTPIITWVTTLRLPRFAAAGPRDGLLLASRSGLLAAQQGGWPVDRIALATWPACDLPPAPANAPPHLAILADTADVSVAGQRFDLSSHQLLWELIEHELRQDPFALNGDLKGYLASRKDRLGIADRGFDARRFIEDLIVPAYQQGLAQALLAAGIPLRLHGKGWDGLAGFAPHWGGPINSADALLSAVEPAAGLVHVWPAAHVHPMDRFTRPVLRVRGGGLTPFLAEARNILSNPSLERTAPCDCQLSPVVLTTLLERL